MTNNLFNRTRTARIAAGLFFAVAFVLFTVQIQAQAKKSVTKKTVAKKAVAKKAVAEKTVVAPSTDLPKVTLIDIVALKDLLKREGDNSKPLLVNFWATWCDPCVEEFPDLIKIANDYQGKIDVIAITLDEPADIDGRVPLFLKKVNAPMPNYLLKQEDADAAINMVSQAWQGGLPFTILYDGKGATLYTKQAKFVPVDLRQKIDTALTAK